MISQSWEFRLRRVATILSVAILTLALLAAISGGLLAFYYEPTAGGAYNSLANINHQIPFGWLIRSLHAIAGNGLIGLGLIQLIIMFLSERFRGSWIAGWISNILLILAAIALSWTAMLLDWSQEGFWRFRIELATIEAIPFIGSALATILTGGSGISTVTVQHLYALHSYALPLGAIALALIHLASLILLQREESQLSSVDPNLNSMISDS